MKLRLTILVLAIVLLASTANALPEEPPGAHLRYRGETIQKAHVAASCWPSPDGGVGCTEKRPMTWPKADKVRAGDRVRLRIHWKREPNRVFVDSYRGVQDNGKPAGEGASVGWHKEPVRRNGDVVAWDIVFRLRAVREHYVKVLAKYPEIVVWNVHVHAVEEL